MGASLCPAAHTAAPASTLNFSAPPRWSSASCGHCGAAVKGGLPRRAARPAVPRRHALESLSTSLRPYFVRFELGRPGPGRAPAGHSVARQGWGVGVPQRVLVVHRCGFAKPRPLHALTLIIDGLRGNKMWVNSVGTFCYVSAPAGAAGSFALRGAWKAPSAAGREARSPGRSSSRGGAEAGRSPRWGEAGEAHRTALHRAVGLSRINARPSNQSGRASSSNKARLITRGCNSMRGRVDGRDGRAAPGSLAGQPVALACSRSAQQAPRGLERGDGAD